jgi:hypothetical protein
MLLTFDSIEEFAKATEDASGSVRHGAGRWTGFLSFSEARRLATVGDDSYVKKAEALINQLDVDAPITKAFASIHSPYGGRVNLGDWLVGSPTPMRRRVRVSSDIGPIKIIVSTTCSAGIDAEVMEKRGAAILALLLKLQQVRPVQLYLLAELHGEQDGWHYQLIRIESQPLAVGVAAFGLCHVAFARQLTYSYARHVDGFNGGWPSDYSRSKTRYAANRAERLGLTDNDLIIPEAHLDDELIQEPLEWIKKRLHAALES